MAAGVAPPVAGMRADVHVTGRRVLATFVDGVVFGLFWVVMAALFGTITTEGPFNWEGALPAVPTVIYAVLVVAYYIRYKRPGSPMPYRECPAILGRD